MINFPTNTHFALRTKDGQLLKLEIDTGYTQDGDQIEVTTEFSLVKSGGTNCEWMTDDFIRALYVAYYGGDGEMENPNVDPNLLQECELVYFSPRATTRNYRPVRVNDLESLEIDLTRPKTSLYEFYKYADAQGIKGRIL